MTAVVATLPNAPVVPGAVVCSEEEALAQGISLVLGYHEERLSLWAPGGNETPLFVDFFAGPLGYRLAAGRAQHERLVRALGKLPPHSRVVDATAGLGRDSAILAAAGLQVTMIEAQPVVQLLLADGLQRLQAATHEFALTLLKGNAEEVLQTLTFQPEVVYLDPMFPERRKSAAIKKDLAWLQHLAPIASAEEESALLAIARATASHKVIVKRPRKAPYLGGMAPSSQLNGKAVRFDVYLPLVS
ncbi:MAG TPA: class I SAM-dependent methyltransferase [Alcanivoracaceae bacterium]|nr:class I SAM-dependent methyltransferase [Alcanivoracaceae bacterium]